MGPGKDKDTGLEPLSAAPWPGPARLRTVGGTGRAAGNGPCCSDAQREANPLLADPRGALLSEDAPGGGGSTLRFL